jgi:DNA-binding XRE family transcriptional regulator
MLPLPYALLSFFLYIINISIAVNRFSLQLTNLLAYVAIWAVITAAQCRAARGLLDWSQQQLADAASVGVVTIRHVEAGKSEPRRSTLYVIKQALESAGVEFTDENGGGPGVRLRKTPQPGKRK